MIVVRIIENNPYSSLKLHFLNQLMKQSPDIRRAQVLMGTAANKSYLKEIGFTHSKIKQASSHNLMVVAEAQSTTIIDETIKRADVLIQRHLKDGLSEQSKRISKPIERKEYLSQREGISPFFFRNFTPSRKMGKIHSIFQSSFNVQFDDQLLNFSTKGMPVTPHGCVLNKEKINRVLQNGKMNELVKLENKEFTFYTRGDIFKLNVSALEVFDLGLPFLRIPKKDIKEVLTYQLLDEIPFEEHIGLERDDDLLKSVNILEQVSTYEDNVIAEAIRHLIGRGNGLTPSGDDILLGYTMVRQAFTLDDYFIERLQQELETINTTTISQAYYESLFAGYVNSLFLALLTAIESDNGLVIEQLLKLITRYGHTSGYDTLYGCYVGLQSLKNKDS